jgi:hypothetical protein
MRIPAHRFDENTLNFQGSKTRTPQPKSNVTQAREAEMQSIYNLASANGVPVDYVVTKILNNSQADLASYVQSKGETPLTDPTALALQATLLRAQDVGTVANTLDISDEDALQTIENNLQEDIDTNSPEQANSPSIAVQAALACAMQFASETASGMQMPSTMSGIVSSIQSGAAKYKMAALNPSKANNDDSSDDDFSDLIDSSDPSPSPNDPSQDAAVPNMALSSVSSSLATIPGTIDATTAAGGLSTITPTVASPLSVSASSLPQASSGTTAGGLFNSISSALSSISNIANQATATSSTIAKAVNGVGANSIATYVQQNSSTIMIFAVIIVIIIVLSINARK